MSRAKRPPEPATILTIHFAASERARRGLAKNHPCGHDGRGKRATDHDVTRWASATVTAWLMDLEYED